MVPVKRASLHERPCWVAERVLPSPPPRDETFDEAILAGEPLAQHPAVVLPGSSDVEVQVLDELLQGEPRPSGPPPQLIADALARLLSDVEVELPSAPEMRVPQEGEVLLPGVHDPRLLRVKRQPEPRHEVLHPCHFSVRSPAGQHDEIVRGATHTTVA